MLLPNPYGDLKMDSEDRSTQKDTSSSAVTSSLGDLIARLEKATEWRSVDGWPYEVSDNGRVRSVRSGRLVRPTLNHNGYEKVMFSVAKARKTFRIHRLLAAAWLGPIPDGMHVNHKDGNKRNNVLDNLEIVSSADNERHAVENGLKASGSRNGVNTKPGNVARGARAGLAKLSEAEVLAIRELRRTGATLRSIASQFDVDQSLISQICSRKIWTHI